MVYGRHSVNVNSLLSAFRIQLDSQSLFLNLIKALVMLTCGRFSCAKAPLSPKKDFHVAKLESRVFLMTCIFQCLSQIFNWPPEGFPGGPDSKESACNAGDPGLIPRLARCCGDGYPVQYSCLENSIDRGAWLPTVHGVSKNWTMTEQLKRCSSGHLVCGSIFLSFSFKSWSRKSKIRYFNK